MEKSAPPKRRSGTPRPVKGSEPKHRLSLDDEFNRNRSVVQLAHDRLTVVLEGPHPTGCPVVPFPFDFNMRLRVWPSDLLRLFGTGMLLHPRVAAAIDYLSFMSRRYLVANPGPDLSQWEEVKKLPLPARSRVLRDESRNPEGEIARAELQRIFRFLSHSHGTAAEIRRRNRLRTFKNLREVVDYEDLRAKGLSHNSAVAAITPGSTAKELHATEQRISSVQTQAKDSGRLRR